MPRHAATGARVPSASTARTTTRNSYGRSRELMLSAMPPLVLHRDRLEDHAVMHQLEAAVTGWPLPIAQPPPECVDVAGVSRRRCLDCRSASRSWRIGGNVTSSIRTLGSAARACLAAHYAEPAPPACAAASHRTGPAGALPRGTRVSGARRRTPRRRPTRRASRRRDAGRRRRTRPGRRSRTRRSAATDRRSPSAASPRPRRGRS